VDGRTVKLYAPTYKRGLAVGLAIVILILAIGLF
jgi:hypothetical protein